MKLEGLQAKYADLPAKEYPEVRFDPLVFGDENGSVIKLIRFQPGFPRKNPPPQINMKKHSKQSNLNVFSNYLF